MTTVADLAAWLERFAPRALAEPWDNVGLLWGDPAAEIRSIMTCLTVTPPTADEALERGVGAIVSHHPIMFKPVKTIRADSTETGFLWRLARGNVAVLSPHTSFDNTEGGINDGLASRLGLTDVRSLRPGVPTLLDKLVVFVPEAGREAVMAAAFDAGAGRIGDYRECSFAVTGQGTFFGGVGTNPALGQAGRRESVAESRVEVICPREWTATVIEAIRRVHPYEEPAIDVYPLRDGPPTGPGTGRVGRLARPERLEALASRIGRELGTKAVQFVGDPDRSIETLAIVCGAGDDFLADARNALADALLTGEARFHRGLEAEAIGVGLIVAGHHATERPGVEDLARRLAATFPELEVWASQTEANPFRSVG